MNLGRPLLILSLGLAACSQPASNSASGPATSAATASAAACPATDFAQFAEVFMADPAVQRQFTPLPLQTFYIEKTPDDLVHRERDLGPQDIRFPLIPNRAEQTKRGLALDLRRTDTAEPSISLSIPNSDYSATYWFTKTDCWRLTMTDNFLLDATGP